MKKWLLIAAAIVVIGIAVIFFGLSKLGPLVKAAVNTYGPQITKTDVRLGDVGISLFSGEVKLKDFFLGNPRGFQTPQAMTVGSIFVRVEKTSLPTDTIIIDKIEVVRPQITYEKASGTDNIQTILNNVTGGTGAATTTKKPAETTGGGKKLVIRDFLMKDGTVNLSMTALAGKTVSANLPDIHLTDIGKSTGGSSPAAAFNEVFAALHKQLTSPAVTDALMKSLKDMGLSAEGLAGQAGKAVGSVGGETSKKLKGFLGR